MLTSFSSDQPMVEIWRGDILESLHRGQAVVVDCAGRVLASYGSPDQRITMRSSAKPFQAIPLLEAGAADALDLDDDEIALCCASHDGESIHVDGARSILRKAGLNEDALRCGAHWPYSPKAQWAAKQALEKPLPAYNNCSGKHSGMLATAVYLREGTADYEHHDHPVQRRIEQVLRDFTGCQGDEMVTAVDGCGVPTYAMPFWRIAFAFARFAEPSSFLPVGSARLEAVHRLTAAMLAHPEMVGGTAHNLDTETMRWGKTRVLTKVGAEGLACAAILPFPKTAQRGIGIAVKVTDGDVRGIRSLPLLHLLKAFGGIDAEGLEQLAGFYERALYNRPGERVGRIALAPAFAGAVSNVCAAGA